MSQMTPYVGWRIDKGVGVQTNAWPIYVGQLQEREMKGL